MPSYFIMLCIFFWGSILSNAAEGFFLCIVINRYNLTVKLQGHVLVILTQLWSVICNAIATTSN